MISEHTKNYASSNGGRPALTEFEAWAAVEQRDRRFDGVFVYAVETTGIFCRPSCPSRRPRRDHVVFHATPEAAERAGFRACLRCRPTAEAGTGSEQAVEKVRAYLEERLDESVTLEELADEVGLSASHLQRTFKRLIGLSPKDYQNARRIEVFKDEVGKDRDVLEATFAAGFGSTRALYEQAEAGLGMTPGVYRRGGDGIAVRYSTFPTGFGRVLVAVTERGVCAVLLAETDEELVTELAHEFPNAEIEPDTDAIREWAEPIVRYLDGVHAHPTAPLDLQGTDFQRRVWRTLQKIPYGETRTYAEVAEMIGRPSAARAVARACASNKVALLVPCHRVIRSDGGISGYRWGKNRKQRLLERESAGSKHPNIPASKS